MAFEVPGVMTELLVHEGQEVTSGQLLATLDPRDYQAGLEAAVAQLEVATLEEERTQILYEKEATSKQRLDIATGTVKVAQANYEKAEKAVQDTSMRAPISGVVAKILVNDIVNVSAKQEILIIQDNSQFKAVVDIPETVGGAVDPRLERGEVLEMFEPIVFLSYAPERGFPAKLTEISLMADKATRTYEATVLFERPEDAMILPGMTARVVITIPERQKNAINTFTISSRAVASDENGNSFVWLVDPTDMSVSRREVSLGLISEDEVEIVCETLKAGDKIITSGVHSLLEGDRVREF